MNRAIVGHVTGVFGIKGEVKCKATSLGESAFVAGHAFTLGSEADARSVRCDGVRRHHDRLLLAFEGFTDPETARTLVGADLYAERGEIVLAADEYLDADLIGMRLVDEEAVELGRVSAVAHYPAGDYLIVEPGGGMVPLIKAFVRGVDLATRTIRTSLPEGLL